MMTRWQRVGLLTFIAGAALVNGGAADIAEWHRIVGTTFAIIGAFLVLAQKDAPSQAIQEKP